MAQRFFYKELVQNPFVVKGKAVPFEQLEGNRGVIVLDSETDKDLVAALDKAASEGRGGIRQINESGYNEKKNSPPPTRLNAPSRRQDEIRVTPKDLSPSPRAKAAEAVNAPDGLPLKDAAGLRLDGPTLEEWAGKGYPPDKYPPEGYAKRTTPRWQEAGQPKPEWWDAVVASGQERIAQAKAEQEKRDTAPPPPPQTIPRPDPVVTVPQGQGTPAPEAEKEKAPETPAFKPKTKKLGKKAEPKVEEAKPTEPEKAE